MRKKHLVKIPIHNYMKKVTKRVSLPHYNCEDHRHKANEACVKKFQSSLSRGLVRLTDKQQSSKNLHIEVQDLFIKVQFYLAYG